LAWQSYGDAARKTIASSFPRLGWVAPQAAPLAQTPPDTIAPAAPSPDQQQLEAMTLDLAAVRQSVDQLAASHEQITRSVDQLAAGQGQITRDITKLQAAEQDILNKISAPPPRPAATPAPRPVPPPSRAPPVR
jgi:septal ring factor EnvC (AmiA/AmiB activator)